MKSIFLIDESPLYVLPSLAKCIGVTKSIIIQHIHSLINERNIKLIKYGHIIIGNEVLIPSIDNRPWIHNTYSKWHEQFPFLSKIGVRKSFNELEKMGILSSFFHSRKRKCYTIDYKVLNNFLQKEGNKEND